MARQDERPPRRWLSGFGALDWRNDEREYAVLLDALTRDRLEAEAVELERVASSRRSIADVEEERQRVARDELAEARRELSEFHAALADVHRRGRSGQAEVAYDSLDPVQNEQADVLIQYLVRPGYAEVRTEEPEPKHYVYHIRVDWPRLRALAEGQGASISL